MSCTSSPCFGGGPPGPRRIAANTDLSHAGWPSNRISNTKYTWYNFVFKNLKEQFSRPMNMYFLLIACLQLIREITPVDPLTTWLPLLVIFTVTAVKEAIDDYHRWKADREANTRTMIVVRNGEEKAVQSQDIHVGDIIKLSEDDEIPCDCVLLTSSDDSGDCFIQTTNLDGESNLKGRSSVGPTKDLRTPRSLGRWRGMVVCNAPDDNLERFDAQLFPDASRSHDDNNAVPLTANNLLLQATNLRNTEWVYAIAVYTGNDSKFGHNKKVPTPKFTRTDDAINEFSVYIFLFQLLLVVVLGVVGNHWKESNGRGYWYLGYPDEGDDAAHQVFIIPARFLLLNSTMIPISLKVTLDLCKLYYAKFIAGDVLLYDPNSDTPAITNSTALSEDLGQVEYVLSDKTGTLTQNVMVLKLCSVLGQQYGSSPEEDADPSSARRRQSARSTRRKSRGSSLSGAADEAAGDSSHAREVGLEDMELRREIGRNFRDGQSGPCAAEMFRCLALNNDVRPEIPSDGSGSQEERRLYKASSPDEEAFVKAAAYYGAILLGREGGTQEQRVSIREGRRIVTYDQLAVFPFTSDRKRMSVLVRCPDGSIRLYSKGADDKLLATAAGERMLSEDDNESFATVQTQVNTWATTGYRTLVMAYKNVSEEDYSQWRQQYDRAARQLENRDEALEATYGLMEQGLTLLGATAIEDKLQDHVPEVIARLREGNVRFWMCTGDKKSTAETIAKTCRLLPMDPLTGGVRAPLSLEGDSASEVRENLSHMIHQLERDGYQLNPLPQPSRLPRFFGAAWCGTRGVGAAAADEDYAPVVAVEPGAGSLRNSSLDSATNGEHSGKEGDGIELNALGAPVERPDGPARAGRRTIQRNSRHRVSESPPISPRKSSSASRSSNSVTPLPKSRGRGGTVAVRVPPPSSSATSFSRKPTPFSIIVRGATIRFALESCREDFARVCLAAKSVICCRVTPKQKAELVRLVRDAGHLALAIGDGGNDVSMIQEAQVGVGIRGKEGLQAARASDYQVGMFQALERLILIHGRYSYYRTMLVAQYSFYKSFVFCFIQIAYASLSGASGVSLFNSITVAAYNAVLFVPIVLFFVDKDVDQEVALKHPASYRPLNENQWLTYKTMAGWFVRGVYHATIMCAILFLSAPGADSAVYESLGLVMFTGYLLVQDFVMFLELRRITWLNIGMIVGFHLLSFLVGIVSNRLDVMSNLMDTGSFDFALQDPVLWLSNLLMLVVAILPWEAVRALQRAYFPTKWDMLVAEDQIVSSTEPLCTCCGKAEGVSLENSPVVEWPGPSPKCPPSAVTEAGAPPMSPQSQAGDRDADGDATGRRRSDDASADDRHG